MSTRALRLTSEADTVDSVARRICEDSGLRGKNIYVVTGQLLTGADFTTERTEPPIHHYDVVLGRALRQPDLERLSRLFASGKRRNPLWSK